MSWRLQSPAISLFVQQILEANTKEKVKGRTIRVIVQQFVGSSTNETSKDCITGKSFRRESTGEGCIRSQRASKLLLSKKAIQKSLYSKSWFHCLWTDENYFREISSKDHNPQRHYNDVIMGAMASQITSLTIVYSTVDSGTDQRKYQSSASLAFVRGIHRWLVNSPHKWPVTRKVIPFDDVTNSNPWSQYTHNTGPFPVWACLWQKRYINLKCLGVLVCYSALMNTHWKACIQTL